MEGQQGNKPTPVPSAQLSNTPQLHKIANNDLAERDSIIMYIDWGTSTIHVLKTDMVLIQAVPTLIYQLDLNVFRLALKALEDTSDGMAFLRTHTHNTTVVVGGATLARVVQIVNGYTVTFEDTQMAVNLVGANSNVGDVVNVNQVSVRSANSAGLQDLNSLQAASYGGGAVTVKSSSTYSGTVFPTGTRQAPVNNMIDAITIATNRGLTVFNIPDIEIIESQDFSDGFTFVGDNPISSAVSILDSANVANCEFVNLRVGGVLDNYNKVTLCDVEDMLHVTGIVKESAFRGTITLGGGIQATLIDCFNGYAGTSVYPTINMGGTGQSLALRNYSGGIKITNSNDGTSESTLNFKAGEVIFDPTVTAGTFVVRGDVVIVNNSTGTANIIDETAARSVWTSMVTGNETIGSFGEAIRSVAFQGAVWVDVNGGTTGTGYPIGTPTNPVNNMLDAIAIGISEGIFHIRVFEDIIIPATADLDGFLIEGSHRTKSQFTVLAGVSTQFSQFLNASITGTLSGWVVVRDCMVEDLFGVQGIFHETMVNSGTIQFAGTQSSHFLSCYSGVPGLITPEYDFNGSSCGAAFRGYNGGMKLVNKTQLQPVSIDLASGQVFIDSTVTSGEIIVRGDGKVIDSSAGATVIDETTFSRFDLQDVNLGNIMAVVTTIKKYDTNRTKIDENTFTLTVYDDDGVTPLTVYDLKDKNGLASFTEIFERVPV